MSHISVTYIDRLGIVDISLASDHGGLMLTPDQTYELYLAIRAILPELPQPLNEPNKTP